ncbi:unnamed protein product [Lampetra planeri]
MARNDKCIGRWLCGGGDVVGKCLRRGSEKGTIVKFNVVPTLRVAVRRVGRTPREPYNWEGKGEKEVRCGVGEEAVSVALEVLLFSEQ